MSDDKANLRNVSGQLSIVVPWEEADDDIKAHGGKIVMPLEHGPSGLGPPSWSTSPALLDAFGNVLGWDDRDLKPLGKQSADEPARAAAKVGDGKDETP